MIGPKTLPTFVGAEALGDEQPAPGSPTVIGTMQRVQPRRGDLQALDRDSTVIAGVITPSPKNSEAPKMPRMPTT